MGRANAVLAQHRLPLASHMTGTEATATWSQSSSGNDMNAYADDLAALIEALDLHHDITVVGHSTGGGKVARWIWPSRTDGSRKPC